MYRPHSEDPPLSTQTSGFRTFRCGHCGAWLVLREGYQTPPPKCGKCHQ